MTFHYKWAGPAGTVPSQVIAHVSSNALWHDGSSGNAADGLGDAYVYTPPSPGHTSAGGGSNGDAYQIKTVAADGTFDVKLTPSVTTNGFASVAVTVAIYPIVLDVGETVLDSDTLYGEVGRLHNTILRTDAPGVTFSNQQYTVSNNAFRDRFITSV